MKTHLLGNVGKGSRQFHQGQARILFGRFLLAHRGMTTRASTLFGFGAWLGGSQRAPFPGILLGSMIGIGVGPLRLGGTGQFFPPLQGSFLPLFRRFLVDELHNVGVGGRNGRGRGSRSVGFGLDLVRPSHPFLTFSWGYFYAYHAGVGRESNYSYLAGHPFHRTKTWRPLRFKTFSTRNNESSETATFCTSGS